jgi:small subunit ribosomal protein S6
MMVIVDPRPTEDEVVQLLTRLKETMKELGVEGVKVDNWGKRRLAYEIRKQREGTYVVFDLLGEPAAMKEFERQLKLNELVLRHLTTRVPIRKKARPIKSQEALEEVS